MAHRFQLKLYIAGQTARSRYAIANLQRVLDERLADQYELTVIDVIEQPELAEKNRILATPCLIREVPPPQRRIVGDMSDVEKVALGLNLEMYPSTPEPRGGES